MHKPHNCYSNSNLNYERTIIVRDAYGNAHKGRVFTVRQGVTYPIKFGRRVCVFELGVKQYRGKTVNGIGGIHAALDSLNHNPFCEIIVINRERFIKAAGLKRALLQMSETAKKAIRPDFYKSFFLNEDLVSTERIDSNHLRWQAALAKLKH